MNSRKPRILIVKLGAVGDVVHTLPALRALRQALPEAHIGWVAHPGPAGLLEGHPALDELILLPRRPSQYGGVTGFRQLLRQIRSARPGWDYAIDFQGLTKSGLVALLSGARERVGFAHSGSRELNPLFINNRVATGARSVIRMNMELLTALGVSPEGAATASYPDGAEHATYIREWREGKGLGDERFLVIDPFAGWETKLWPAEHWAETARRATEELGLRPLIFYGPGEKDHAAELAGQMDGAVLAPETTLLQYVALLRQCARAIIAADTGPMHIAASLGVPAVALFGPSDPARNGPHFTGARYKILQDPSQPCANTFARRCQYHDKAQCMATITPDMALAALSELLNGGTAAEGLDSSGQ